MFSVHNKYIRNESFRLTTKSNIGFLYLLIKEMCWITYAVYILIDRFTYKLITNSKSRTILQTETTKQSHIALSMENDSPTYYCV